MSASHDLSCALGATRHERDALAILVGLGMVPKLLDAEQKQAIAKTQLQRDVSERYPDPQKPNKVGVSEATGGPALTVAESAFLGPFTPLPGLGHIEQTRSGRELPFCRRTGMLWQVECSEGHKARKWIACGKHDCKTCEAMVRKRRGGKLYERIGGARVVGLWVLTWPSHWNHALDGRLAITQAGVGDLRRVAAQVIRQWYQAHYRADVGLNIFIHPEGDKTPGRWLPHLHAEVPHIGLDRGCLVELDAMITPESREDMKSRWGYVLDQVAEMLGEPPPARNIHYRFADTKVKKLHNLEYDGRPFPHWAAGEFEKGLRTGRPYGLLAPNCKTRGVARWRAAVAAPDEEPEPLDLERCSPDERDEAVRRGRVCHACDCQEIEVVRTVPASMGHKLVGPLLDVWALKYGDLVEQEIEESMTPSRKLKATDYGGSVDPLGIPF